MAKKTKPEPKSKKILKLKKLNNEIDLKDLMTTYKLTKKSLIKSLNDIIDEELEENPKLNDKILLVLVMRSFKLAMRGHSISNAIPVEVCTIAKKSAYDYAERRISDLKKLFLVDPDKAINVGIGDAICDENGEVFYSKSTFNKGEYPEHKYIYPVIFLMNDGNIMKSVSVSMFEDNLELFNELEENVWFKTKMIVTENKTNSLNLTGKFTSLSKVEPINKEKLTGFANLNDETGLIYEEPLSLHRLDLHDAKKYFDKYQVKGILPVERYIIVIGDVVGMSDTGRVFSIVDDSCTDKDESVTVYDNRGEEVVSFGPKSKILIIGQLSYDAVQKKSTINCMSVKLIPTEKGGYFYPSKIKKVTTIQTPDDKKSKKSKKEKTNVEEQFEDMLEIDESIISPDVQSEIVSALYSIEGKGTYDEILEKTGLDNNKEYNASFLDLLRKKVFKKTNGEYEI